MKRSFNGRKLSHSTHSLHVANMQRRKCPICGTDLRLFLGMLRYTELKRGKGGNDYRVIKHGSLRTIRKRMKQQSQA